MTRATRLVVGIGNRDRGDDGVGPAVAARVADLVVERGVTGVAVVVQDEPLALVEHLDGPDHVVVVDALAAGRGPGWVEVWHVGSGPLPQRARATGSHGLGVVDAVELARVLGRMPRRLTLVGVKAGTDDHGAPLSPPVREHLDEAAEAVLALLSAEGVAEPR